MEKADQYIIQYIKQSEGRTHSISKALKQNLETNEYDFQKN